MLLRNGGRKSTIKVEGIDGPITAFNTINLLELPYSIHASERIKIKEIYRDGEEISREYLRGEAAQEIKLMETETRNAV